VKRWKARILSSFLAASVLVLAAASPALATQYCNVFDGNWGRMTVCIENVNSGYDAWAYHDWGPTYLVDFNLDCQGSGYFGDAGAFSIAAGQLRTYFFAVGNKPACQVLLFWRSGSPQWVGPPYPPNLFSPWAINP
jgi:hypothetical protein